MIARLSACFVLSVLLHGLVLLSFNPAARTEGGRGGRMGDAASNKLDVYLVATGGKNKLPAPAAKPGAKTEAPVQENIPAHETPAPAEGNRLPGFSGSNWPGQPAPEVRYPAQTNYRQMYEAQAKQQAQQQAAFAIARLQADIEQRINLKPDRIDGECVWQPDPASDAPTLQCKPEALARLMQDASESLASLRQVMQGQGIVLDGLTVVTRGGRTTISYHGHPARADSAP